MDIHRKLRVHMRQSDSLALSAVAMQPMPVWTRYWTRPIKQSAMMAFERPLFKRFVVEPKVNLRIAAVTVTEHASAALPKATVLTLRLILNAEQMPASAPIITAA